MLAFFCNSCKIGSVNPEKLTLLVCWSPKKPLFSDENNAKSILVTSPSQGESRDSLGFFAFYTQGGNW